MVKSGLHPLVLDANMSNRGVFSRAHSVFNSLEAKRIECDTLVVAGVSGGGGRDGGVVAGGSVHDRPNGVFEETPQADGTVTTTATVDDGGEVRYERGTTSDGLGGGQWLVYEYGRYWLSGITIPHLKADMHTYLQNLRTAKIYIKPNHLFSTPDGVLKCSMTTERIAVKLKPGKYYKVRDLGTETAATWLTINSANLGTPISMAMTPDYTASIVQYSAPPSYSVVSGVIDSGIEVGTVISTKADFTPIVLSAGGSVYEMNMHALFKKPLHLGRTEVTLSVPAATQTILNSVLGDGSTVDAPTPYGLIFFLDPYATTLNGCTVMVFDNGQEIENSLHSSLRELWLAAGWTGDSPLDLLPSQYDTFKFNQQAYISKMDSLRSADTFAHNCIVAMVAPPTNTSLLSIAPSGLTSGKWEGEYWGGDDGDEGLLLRLPDNILETLTTTLGIMSATIEDNATAININQTDQTAFKALTNRNLLNTGLHFNTRKHTVTGGVSPWIYSPSVAGTTNFIFPLRLDPGHWGPGYIRILSVGVTPGAGQQLCYKWEGPFWATRIFPVAGHQQTTNAYGYRDIALSQINPTNGLTGDPVVTDLVFKMQGVAGHDAYHKRSSEIEFNKSLDNHAIDTNTSDAITPDAILDFDLVDLNAAGNLKATRGHQYELRMCRFTHHVAETEFAFAFKYWNNGTLEVTINTPTAERHNVMQTVEITWYNGFTGPTQLNSYGANITSGYDYENLG